ncbi:MAG: PD-(D/E)XK nuclease family protein [Lachnospiraceae bacterium]|nr:PD-(D/E)XK nuclease family protein [Lachnospiraceae bacterium]
MRLQEWCRSYPKERKIILTDNRSNVERIKRRVNHEENDRFQIINLEGLRLEELAKRLYIGYAASEGICKKVEYVEKNYCSMLIYNIISDKSEIYTFIPKESICMDTMGEILRVINIIRSGKLVSEDALSSGSLKEQQLKALIKDFEEKLLELDQYDEIRLMDELLKNEEASRYVRDEIKKYKVACFSYMKEKLTFIEKKFIGLLGEEIVEIDPFADGCEKRTNIADSLFVKAYGQNNEIQKVIDEIAVKGYALGEINIIYSSDEYETLLRSILCERGIPYFFETDYSVQDKSYIKLMMSILDWASDDYSYEKYRYITNNPLIRQGRDYNFGVKAGIGWGLNRYKMFLDNMSEERRDDYTKLLIKHSRVKERKDEDGQGDSEKLQLCSEEYISLMDELVRIFDNDSGAIAVGELYNGITSIILRAAEAAEEKSRMIAEEKKIEKKGSIKNRDKAYYTAMTSLHDYFDDFRSAVTLEEAIRLIKDRVQKIVWQDENDTSKVSLMKMGGLNVLERKHQFVVGMSHDSFEPKLIDSPVINDGRIMELLDPSEGYIQLITMSGREKSEDLNKSVQTIDGGSLCVIASSYNTREFREIALSTTFLEMYDAYGKSELLEFGYPNVKDFENSYFIDKTRLFEGLQQESDKPDDVPEDDEDADKKAVDSDADETKDDMQETKKRYGYIEKEDVNGYEFIKLPEISVSRLQKLLECPWKFDYQMKIYCNNNIERNPVTWLPINERGTFFHQIFEEYCNQKLIDVDAAGQSLDKDVFEAIYNNAVSEFRILIPEGSEVERNIEEWKMKQLAERYLNELYEELAESGYRVSECEKKFITKDKYIYKDPDTDEFVETENPDEVRNKGIHLSFYGYMDRVDEKTDVNGEKIYRIIDYKSGRRNTLLKKITGDDDHDITQIQHYIYMKALEEEKSVDRVDFIYEFTSSENDKIYYINDITDERMMAQDAVPDRETMFHRLYEIMFNVLIDNKAFTPKEDACKYCDYTDICMRRMNFE